MTKTEKVDHTTTGNDNFTALQYGVNVIGIYFYEDGFVILSPKTDDQRINYTIFIGGVRTMTSTIYKNYNGKSVQVAIHESTPRGGSDFLDRMVQQQNSKYQKVTKQSCEVTHCDSCKRYTLRTKCPALVIKISVQINSEDECYTRCYKDDECEAFHLDNTAHVCRVFINEVDPDGQIISPIFRKLP
ncbi:unnamed protein product [Mytilus coruscus]|uniref:Apple domain-containing protein n=1 Tax=Mytilus coruscus TaxID=42192 RepID=A0A6J7ZY34_MYTCO|nr:unnamed protein product [Mytilus coruscus]